MKNLKRKRNEDDNYSPSESSESSEEDYFDDYNENTDFPEFKITIDKIQTLDDLIQIGEEWNKYYNENKLYVKTSRKKRKINETIDKYYEYKKIFDIHEQLQELNSLIGMKELKRDIVNQILFYVQNLNDDEMMHTVLMGDPGVGKTSVGRILGRIYNSLGILSRNKFVIAKRNDFIGKYLGHTANKTQQLLESCKGGVLFIDEAYSLGPGRSDSDSFSKEAIDTLNQFLSENCYDFICIIAGYEDSLNQCFFSRNPGLERRFPWKFRMASYTYKELIGIFLHCIEKEGWKIQIDKEILEDHFNKNKDIFTENGGDCKILFDKCKIVHAKRLFLIPRENKEEHKKIINNQDFIKGFKSLITLKNKKKKEEPPMGIYM